MNGGEGYESRKWVPGCTVKSDYSCRENREMHITGMMHGENLHPGGIFDNSSRSKSRYPPPLEWN